jgi:hypothetical protein
VAEVHDGFAGRGQMVLLNLVEPAPALHHHAGKAAMMRAVLKKFCG